MSNSDRLNVNAVAMRLGVHKQTIWRWYSAGDFPKPHYLGQYRLWFVEEVDAWATRQMAKRFAEKLSA